MADLEGTWWWDLDHKRAEKWEDTESPNRLGPFPTREAAENAVDTMAARDKSYDEQDERWENGD